ncbi:MAG: DUF4864 domain-containing protein [Pseudomonadota bacterium]
MLNLFSRIGLKFILAPVVALMLAASSVSAQSDEDAREIEETIRSQILAMQDDDWVQAFSYASPMIQGMFRDAETFSRMVTTGYPMVWRPKRYDLGTLEMTARGPVQTMFFEDQQGRLFIADYYMQQVDGIWRINGVQIRPAPQESV